MYKEMILLLLLSEYSSTEEPSTQKTSTFLNITSPKLKRQPNKTELPVTDVPGHASTQTETYPSESPDPTEHKIDELEYDSTSTNVQSNGHQSTPKPELKEGSGNRLTHAISGPVVTIIVFAVMAVIVGVIILVSLLVRRLTRKNSFNLKNKDTVSP
ncbi:glycophorin-A isoform X1 [Monodelphis domestica]|uniref:glycophorin-A isoform X1 n=1 Tax=Monodelphis domestica TaxID=13616 RepID=UPI0024E1AC81|nr:glycophorin-A isoform X1 [Monodelphis domestica]